MNWVGGSRNRFMMKSDAKKQREFFEKRKMQQKLKNLGIPLPGSSQISNSGSMDLVTLFIVNQIAAKKENNDVPKVAVLGSSKAGSKHKRNEPLVLPMSPCAPSQLSLVESESQCSQGTRKRKHVIPQVFKCKQLSPVLESGFSDNSASDYLPPITGPRSPFSSTTSASSHPGIFPLQLNPEERSQLQPHCSPSPWDISGPEQIKPFLQPTLMKDPWSCGSKPPLYQVETPAAVQVLFGSPQPSNPEARTYDRQGVTFALSQPEDQEPVLDFTLNHSETVDQFGNEFFLGFSNDKNVKEASDFGRTKLKIYLQDDTPNRSRSQSAPDSQHREVELSNCTDTSFSCHQHSHMDCCEYSPGYLSSDSDDDECCQSCFHAPSSNVGQLYCADTLNLNPGSQQNPKETPLTPHMKSHMNPTDDHDHQSVDNVDCHDQSGGNDDKQAGSSTSPPLPQSPSTDMCKCMKTSSESRDAETQTVDAPAAETCDAATQCCFVSDSVTKPSGFSFYQQTVDVSARCPATGRQSGCTDAAAEPHRTPSESSTCAGKRMLWSTNKYRAGSLSGSSILHQLTAKNSERRATLQAPISPFQHIHKSNTRDKKDGEDRDKENGAGMKDDLGEVMEEASRASRLSEDPETLQEIADILLLLRQKKEE